MKLEIEYTDTFGGEANYSWCRRREITLPDDATDAQIKRAAKQALKLSGIRGKWEKIDDDLVFRPSGIHTILFIS